MIGYDCIGVGASTGSYLNELGFRNHWKFNAGAGVFKPEARYGSTKIRNRDYFHNVKAQAWWGLADRFRATYNAVKNGSEFNPDTMISISGDIPPKLVESLAEELCAPRMDTDHGGKVRVESKKDMKKRGVNSPNIADAVIISCSKHMGGVSRSLGSWL